MVEVPATVDAGGIHPLAVGPHSEFFAGTIRPQATIMQLVTEAYRTGRRRPLVQTLLLDPLVDSVREAERLLEEMLDLQKDSLPELA